jgi:ESS family glutamate:Na+ symporter
VQLTAVGGVPGVTFGLIPTLALAALVLFFGTFLQRSVPLLSHSNIPGPVIGGLLFAGIVFVLHGRAILNVQIDSVLRNPLQIAFFTTIGLSATLSVFRSGGRNMVLFACIIISTGIVQNVVGVVIASAIAPLALGLICGSVTLLGGPATGLAFTPTFERLGIGGAGALIIASATFGICVASVVGNPVATVLIRRFNLASPNIAAEPAHALHAESGHVSGIQPVLTGRTLLHNLLLLLVVMGVGALLYDWHVGRGVILPNFMAPVVVAAIVRNVDDRFGWFKLHGATIEVLGAIALALFLAVALMDLKLWQLSELAIPMMTILIVQVVITVAYAVLTTFMVLGRDYEAAVATTGHIGFAIGIATNAVANMQTLIARFGPAPRSFVMVPVVSLFAIDFVNPIIIVLFARFLR